MVEEILLATSAARASAKDLAALFQGCRGRAHSVALQITGDPEEAADVVQEAFLRAGRGLHRFRGEGTLEAWVLRIVVNLALKSLRRQRLRRRVGPLLSSLGWGGRQPAADWLAGCAEELRQLADALDRLPPRQRAVFVLRHGHDLSVAEVAGLLGLSVPTVKTHLLRAVERLRREMRRAGR